MAKDKDIEAQRKAKYLSNTPERKRRRKEKRASNKRYNRSNATWYENGRCMQHCGMGGTCEFPCNGNC